jgi:hypothetical protein
MKRRAGMLLGATLLASVVTVPLSVGVARAATLPPMNSTPTAARNFGNGGPSDQALVVAGPTAIAADGAIVFFDKNAHQLRRVDPATSVVSALAGTGTSPTAGQACAPDTAGPALSSPLSGASMVAALASGDILMSWQPPPFACYSTGYDVYRWDHLDLRWHLVLANLWTPCCSNERPRYTHFAARANGDLYAYDVQDNVIRHWLASDGPTAAGVVIAGVTGSPGYSGDGGPATSAQLAGGDVLAVAPDGKVFVFAYGRLRMVDTAGVISTIAGGPGPVDLAAANGLPANQVPMDVVSLATSADSTTVFVGARDSAYNKVALLAFAPGGNVSLLAGPAECYSPAVAQCPGTVLTERLGSQVLTTSNGTIRAWPRDGSLVGAAGLRVVGADDSSGQGRSPDGAPLSRAFLGYVNGIAQSPDGTFALATASGVRTLTGLSANDKLGSLSPLRLTSMVYGADGTLYGLHSSDGSGDLPRIVAIATDGTARVLVGGGEDAFAPGALGTSVALPLANGSVHFGVDSTMNRLFVDIAQDHIWAVDLTSGEMQVFAGNGSFGLAIAGSSAATAPLPHQLPRALAVNPATHQLYAIDEGGGGLRFDSSGLVSVVDCESGCPYDGLQVMPDGSLVGVGRYGPRLGSFLSSDLLVRSSAGTIRALTDVGPVVGTTSDGRLISPISDPPFPLGRGLAGLLKVTDPIASPTFVDPRDNVSTTAIPAGITVSLTEATAEQETAVYLSEVSAQGDPMAQPVEVLNLGPAATGTVRTFDFYRLGQLSGGGQPLLAGHTYRFDVVSIEHDATTRDSVMSAPQRFTVTPLADNTAPTAPQVSLNGFFSAGIMNLHIQAPGSPDLERVEVRQSPGATAPASIDAGDFAAESHYLERSASRTVSVDPLVGAAFAAFAVDTSGNVSPAGTVVRLPASLVSGEAVTGVAYQAHNGSLHAVWTGGPAMAIRYAAGIAAPGAPTQGTATPLVDSTWGAGASVPVANGAKVALSVFSWADNEVSTYRRTTFVLTGGLSSDSVSIAATATVNPGQRPAVTAKLTRRAVSGSVGPLTGMSVSLYRRPVGTGSWLKVASTNTSNTGAAAFTVPIPTGHTDYQVRASGIDDVQLTATARTNVRQLVTAALSTTSVRHGSAVLMKGVVTPHRALRVYLQRYSAGVWHNVVYVTSASTGAYSLRFIPTAAGTFSYRVWAPATSTLLLGLSPTRVLRVT